MSAVGLPNNQRPYEVQLKAGAAPRGFMDGYKRYDTKAEGYGEPAEWRGNFQSAMGDANEQGDNDATRGDNLIITRRRVIRDDD